MIPAKIINLDPVQVTYYKLPIPAHDNYKTIEDYWNTGYRQYLASKFIADVENVQFSYAIQGDGNYKIKKDGLHTIIGDYLYLLSLNQSCFIEETTEGKCRIIKI